MHRDTPPDPNAAAPDADRSAAQTVPAGRVSAGPLHETLELVRRLSMIPDTGPLLLIVCRLGIAVAALLTAAAPHADKAVVLNTTGEPPVDEAPPGGEAVAVDATGEPPVEASPGGEAGALDATRNGPALVAEAPPVDGAVAVDATAAADVEDGPPADVAVIPDAAGVSAAGLGDALNIDQVVVGGGAANGPYADADADADADAASDGTADVDNAPPCAGVTAGHVEIAADVDRPIRDAVLPRHQAFALVQPEPRCRDLGTLGPRGPPAPRSG